MICQNNERGSVLISTNVYTDIAGAAAINCMGVKGMVARSVKDGVYHLLRRESMSKGVKVDFYEDGEITIELHVMVGDGVNLKAIGDAIIEEVRYMVEKCTGTHVRAVNVHIDALERD